MSVLERTKSRVVERAIPADGGEVGVRVEFGGNLVIKWLCGDTRTFDAAKLAETIADIELFVECPDVWYEGVDSRGRMFYAKVVAGELYANTVTADGSHHVNWVDLKRALKKMAK